mmetsp:Transcript_7734/g.23229  ORF Transcript_7734/g.23229 Transcript_7734/m.23229 type:complete len:201 (-) Transcript_7734:214-816(-)
MLRLEERQLHERAAWERAHKVGEPVGAGVGLVRRGALGRGGCLQGALEQRLKHKVVGVEAEKLAEEAHTCDAALRVVGELLCRQHHGVHLGDADADAERLEQQRVGRDVLTLVVIGSVCRDRLSCQWVNWKVGAPEQFRSCSRPGIVRCGRNRYQRRRLLSMRRKIGDFGEQGRLQQIHVYVWLLLQKFGHNARQMFIHR